MPEVDSRHVTLHERGVHSDAVASSMLATLGSLIRLVALTATRLQEEVLSNQRGYCTKKEGPKDPSVRR